MNKHFPFEYPILIYDDSCSSCYLFAKFAQTLSFGWIKIVGHFYSNESLYIRSLFFPKDYDPTIMFWLVNTNGAWGARSGLLPLSIEILTGIFKFVFKNNNTKINHKTNHEINCVNNKTSCRKPQNIFKRILSLFKNTGKFTFND